MDDLWLEPTLISPVTVDSGLDEGEVDGWENEGGSVLHDYEPTAEGDNEEEG